MNKKNITVIGSSGMLGNTLTRYFLNKSYRVVSIDKSKFNILTDPLAKLEKEIEKSDLIINCTGIIKPRIEKTKIDDIFLINSIFPKNLATLCNMLHIKCIQITTDCAFSGKNGPYKETDYFDANDIYGISKIAGETNDCMFLRTSIIGEEQSNKYSLLEWAKSQKGKVVPGFTNHYWNGVTTLYLAEVIEQILNDNLYKKGIFHIYSKKSLSKMKLLKIISKIYKLDETVKPIKAPFRVNRVLSSIYDLSSIIITKSIEQQILEMRDFYKNN